MELAGRAFDAITNRNNIDDNIRQLFPKITEPDYLLYWRKVLRAAALCHDLGHPPFSHAAEKELFPVKFNHEKMTEQIILSDEMKKIWEEMIPPLNPGHIVKLALGPEKSGVLIFTDWEALLAEIITGDSLGVDRMDYLLRDAYHAGVGYGKFDHFRLLETLRILPPPPAASDVTDPVQLNLIEEKKEEASNEPMLGLLIGGLHSAEALLLARYFMYSQVYFHPVRLAYNHHLKEFLLEWLPNKQFPTDCLGHLALTDNEVTSAMRKAAFDSAAPGHVHAKRIICREHFKVLYEFNHEDAEINPQAGKLIFEAAVAKFGKTSLIRNERTEKGNATEFPVRLKDGRSVTSLAESELLLKMPGLVIDYILIESKLRDEAVAWLKTKRSEILGA
jgi:HD superfamily phosphohydrolase